MKHFKVKSLHLTSVNVSSDCRFPVLHSSNTTISELFPHFEINACHPGCLIVLFFHYPAPSVIGTHYKTLILPEVGQRSWCDETELKPDQMCSKACLQLVYEAWNWASRCCLHTYAYPDWKYSLEWTISLCVAWKYMPEYTQQISVI